MPVDVQIFTTSGTWTKINGIDAVRGVLIGGGGAGGDGAQGIVIVASITNPPFSIKHLVLRLIP